MRVMLLSSLVALAGCSTIDDWAREGYVLCGERELNIFSDPQNCGGCPGEKGHEVCAEGVACVQGYCDYTSVLHCGEAGRMCMAGSSCVAVPEVDGGTDAGVPPHGPVVEGYACTIISGDAGLAGDAGVDERGSEARFALKQARADAPSWVFIPGESEACRTGDEVRCHHAYVSFTDICGERCGPFDFDYDFHIMTTEMSRGQYREAMCDCGRVRSTLCADVCTNRGPSIDALPMTGLNWCMAQEACEALGGRLPTTLERARLDEVIANEHRLSAETSCTEWSGAVGSRPQVAECIDDDAEPFVIVDDPRGAVPLGSAALWEPIMMHHTVGNVAEWLYDPPAGFRCGEYEDETTTLRVPRAWEGLRTMQGRSVMSPTGLKEARAIGLAPNARATDLGARCVRPRPGSTSALLASLPPPIADCLDKPLGLRPVRRGQEPIYRAVEACAVSQAPTSVGMDELDNLAEALLSDETPLAWRRGDSAQIGQAWMGEDAQWWTGEPAHVGATLTYDFYGQAYTSLKWASVATEVPAMCADRMSTTGYTNQDGYIVRQIELVVERAELGSIVQYTRDPVALACRHLECDGTYDPADCEGSCEAWRLRFVVGFEQVEPFAYPDLCR